MYIQAKLTPNYLMTTKQSPMSGITPAPSSPTAKEASPSVSTKEVTPGVKTTSWGQRVHYRTTRSLSALDAGGAAKATKKSAASLAARNQLMNDLLNKKELFLKTSYGHSPQKLHLAARMLNEHLSQPGKDLTALRLLTKYIESDYKRVKETVPSSLQATKARQAAGRALSRLGKYLTAEVPRMAGSNPAMMTLTETWINALIESMRRQPTAGHFAANFATVEELMRFLLSDSSRRMGDYAFYRCFSLLCDLFAYVPNFSSDSRYLYS